MSLYEINDTMKLIGKQSSYPCMRDSEWGNLVNDVAVAHTKYFGIMRNQSLEIGFDYLLLGIMIGKKLARRKRGKKNE